jgi:putative flippase GtrA
MTGTHNLVAKLIRFGAVGVIAAMVYVLAVVTLVSGLGVPPIGAAVLGYLIALPVSFMGHRAFTFRSKATMVPELARFTVMHLVNMMVSLGAMAWAVNLLGLEYWVGILAAVAIVPLASYITSDLWVFVDRKAGRKE